MFREIYDSVLTDPIELAALAAISLFIGSLLLWAAILSRGVL